LFAAVSVVGFARLLPKLVIQLFGDRKPCILLKINILPPPNVYNKFIINTLQEINYLAIGEE